MKKKLPCLAFLCILAPAVMGGDADVPNQLYLDFVNSYLQAAPIIQMAEREGIRVDSAEVSARVKAYEALFSDRIVDPGKVERQLKAEKYLGKMGFQVDENALKRELDSRGYAPSGEPPHRQAVISALRGKLLLAKQDVLEHSEITADQIYLRNQEIMENSRAQWPLDSLQIQGDPKECLAWLEGNCFATLEEYNAAAGFYGMTRGIPLDTAKTIALKKYLVEKHVASREASAGDDFEAEEILAMMKEKKEKLLRHAGMQVWGRPVRDPRILAQTYDKYYRTHFQAKAIAYIRIIGSSDSAYVDSVHRSLLKWERESAVSREARRAPPPEPELPWQLFQTGDLSPELAGTTDTLRPGHCGLPVKTKWGYFIPRIEKRKWTREVSFREANAMLIYLATRDKFAGKDSMVTEKARKYYQANLSLFRNPDTLSLTAWLLPNLLAKQTATSPNFLSARSLPDTAKWAPLRICSLDLPEGIRRLVERWDRKFHPGSFAGPWNGEYGRWFFRVDSARKGRGNIPFYTAKQGIQERLLNPGVEADAATTENTRNQVLTTIGAAMKLRSEEIGKLRSMSNEEVERWILAGKLDSTAVPKGADQALRAEVARRHLVQSVHSSRRSERQAILGKLRINYARLSGG